MVNKTQSNKTMVSEKNAEHCKIEITKGVFVRPQNYTKTSYSSCIYNNPI